MEPVSERDERRVRALERIAGILGWAAGVAAVALIVWLLGDILLLVFAASLFALGLRALMTLLGRKIGTGSGASLAIVVSALLALLGAGAWWAGPRLESEAGQLQDQLVEQWTAVRAWLRASSWGTHVIHQLPASVGGGSESSSFAPRVAGIIAGALWSGIGVLGTIVLVIATAIYFAAAPGPYINGPLRLVPKQHRGVTRHVLGVVGHSLQFWLAGQLLDMMVVGAVTGGGLALLGIPLAFILGVIAGLLNFVPYMGAIGGAVPALLIAFSQGSQQALFVAILFLVVQTLEGNVLSPLIQRRAVDLPPAATILAQAALGALFGLPGIILATPMAAAILATMRELTSEED